MATRRLRPEDWAPLPQTRIQIRATQSPREPRDEHVKIPKCAQKAPRPTPINYPPGESPIAKGRESLDADSPRAPEVVDFAAPSTWPRRGLPPHIVYQQQQWGGRRVGSPSSVSQCSARQSEMSFGILDYYTRDPSPTRSPTLPLTPKLPQISQGPPKIGTPVIDPAMEKFDFGLPLGGRPQSRTCGKKDDFEIVRMARDASAGAQQSDLDSVGSEPPIPPPKSEKAEPVKTTYSLFPKDTTPPCRPSLTIANREDSSPSTQGTAPSSNISSIPSHPQPDPSYRARKESLTSSLRSRKDSFTSYRANAQRIPLRVFSASSSNSNSSVYTTPRTSNAIPTCTIGGKASSSTASPPDSAHSNSTPSRWSEDTVTSPTVAAFSGQVRRASFGSLLRCVEDERSQSGRQYPACFFEEDDDDDEVAPLRRKLNWGRSGGLQSPRARKGRGGSGSGEWEGDGAGLGGKGGWRRVLLCGCGE